MSLLHRGELIRNHFRIRTRLFLLVLTLAVPFIGYSVFSSFAEARLETDHAATQMLGTARVTAARLDDHVGDIRQLLKVLTVLVSVDPRQTVANDTLLQSLAENLPEHVSNLTVWAINGDNIGAVDQRIRVSTDQNARSRSFFKDSVLNAHFGVEAPVALADGQLVGVFSLPVLRAGQVVGAVAASVPLSTLKELLTVDMLPEEALVTVVSPQDLVLARTIDSDRWLGKRLSPPGGRQRQAGKREGAVVGPSADGIERVGGYTIAHAVPWLVFVGMPKDLALAAVHKRLKTNLLNAGGMLLLGSILAYAIGEGIASPLRKLSAEALELGGDEMLRPIQTKAQGEVGVLATTLNRMIERVQDRSAALRASEQQLRLVTDNLPALISYLDTEQRFRFANGQYATWFGVTPSSLTGKAVSELYGDETYGRFGCHLDRALTGSRVTYERAVSTLQGLRQVEVSVTPDKDEHGSVQGLFVLISDITDARQAAAELAASRRQLQMVADNIPALISYVDRDERFRYVNNTGERVFGTRNEDLVGRSYREVRGEALYAEIAPHMAAALAGRNVSFDGTWSVGEQTYHYQSSYVPDVLPNGEVAGFYAMTFDITALKETQRELDSLARHDPLTGLPNRREFTQRLQLAMERSRRSRQLMALVFMDIDRFKVINDTHGHGIGDAVLKEFGTRLRRCTRVADTVARLAGDEFVVVLEGLSSTQEVSAISEKIVHAIRQPMRLDGLDLLITSSLGYATYDGMGGDVEALTAKADEALYRAKQSGRDRFAATTFVDLA